MTKVDRQVRQFKGRMLKGKIGGRGEVRTQRLVHDELLTVTLVTVSLQS